MKKFISLIAITTLLFSCNGGGNNNTNNGDEQNTDSLSAEEPAKVKLVADEALNKAAHYYADKVDYKASTGTLSKVDSIINADMKDLREKCDFVYYPFSGPDFFYPYTMFPDADTYFMLGLENPGMPLTTIDEKSVSRYSTALYTYLRSSYFCTNAMKNDLANEDIDGIIPVVSMLMAKKDCEIISVKFKDITEDSKMVDSEKASNIAEIKFFATSNPYHEQTLYFMSANVANSAFKENVANYLNQTLSQHKVVTFLKAASYVMYKDYFSTIRNTILDNSFAVLQDDSGIPYRFFKDWDNTLYGKYIHPLKLFTSSVYQPDLDSLYKASDVKPLDIHIGYNLPSNWMCARKK